jgi:hypothetical protein
MEFVPDLETSGTSSQIIKGTPRSFTRFVVFLHDELLLPTLSEFLDEHISLRSPDYSSFLHILRLFGCAHADSSLLYLTFGPCELDRRDDLPIFAGEYKSPQNSLVLRQHRTRHVPHRSPSHRALRDPTRLR